MMNVEPTTIQPTLEEKQAASDQRDWVNVTIMVLTLNGS